MNILLLDLIGAIGFQINDTFTTYLGVSTGAVELNSFFKFLEERKTIDFVLVGIIKVLVAIYIYALTLFNPGYSLGLEFDFLPRSSSYLVEYIRDLSP